MEKEELNIGGNPLNFLLRIDGTVYAHNAKTGEYMCSTSQAAHRRVIRQVRQIGSYLRRVSKCMNLSQSTQQDVQEHQHITFEGTVFFEVKSFEYIEYPHFCH